MEEHDDALDEFFALELLSGKREALRDVLRKNALSEAIVNAFLCLPYEENLSEREKVEAPLFADLAFAEWKLFKLEWRFCKDEGRSESESERAHYLWVIDDCFRDKVSEPRIPVFFGLFSRKVESIPHRNLAEFLAICREYYREYEPDGSLVNP